MDPANENFLLQQFGERIEKLSQQDKLSKFCMQDFWMLLKSDNTAWRKILQNSQNSQMQWPVVSTLCQQTKEHHNQKDGSKGTTKLGPYLLLQPVACTVSTELKSELCLWTETILTPGSEFLMDQTSLWWIWKITSRKFQVQLEEYRVFPWLGPFPTHD